jgi:hypothetical protein
MFLSMSLKRDDKYRLILIPINIKEILMHFVKFSKLKDFVDYIELILPWLAHVARFRHSILFSMKK